VVQQIAAVAEQEKVDLVIVSPHRHAGLRHWLFGSVTDQVARFEPVPHAIHRRAVAPQSPGAAKSCGNFSSGRAQNRKA